ncbi:transcriptional regulator, TetR family [Haloplanus vescus]|uniref:Transcriptional regulator, TetR family n=1 Tax=Haloplanus vescus TaxID=555874 RepID=A0A1H3WCJ8_9EURY|nr:TetR/AcrR family transcriptional regulator [Haloplanus vescus]SDZ84072.1 transcriptional regulator, TetR family [Haloplanus vescus]
MPFDAPFGTDTDETRTAILRATYAALIEHGYEDLTVQRIGDEFPKSKSLIYQHYDGKDEVLVALLEYLLDHFESQIPEPATDDADDCLQTLLSFVLAPDPSEARASLTKVMAELRGQAPHNETFRSYFSANDRRFRRDLATLIERGVDEGVYRPVDAESVASFLLTVLAGETMRRATTDGTVDSEAVCAELNTYVETRLLDGTDD